MDINGFFSLRKNDHFCSKAKKMDEALIKNLIYITQLGLFAGIAMIIFAWVEKKVLIEKAGQLVFVVLGVLAGWILASGSVVIPEPTDGTMPEEMSLVFYLFGLIVASLIGLTAFILHLLKSRFVKAFNVLLVVCALLLFFMVYNLITG